MKVTLGIGDRILVTKMLLSYKGSVTNWKSVDLDLSKVALTEEENKTVNIREEGGRLFWNGNLEVEFDLSEATINYIKSEIESKDADRSEFALYEKLSLEDAEVVETEEQVIN